MNISKLFKGAVSGAATWVGGGIGGALVIITTSPDIGTTSTAGGFKGTKGTAQGS